MLLSNSIIIEIAGLGARFSGLSGDCLNLMKKRYAAFISDSHDFEWTLDWTEKNDDGLSWDVAMETRDDRWLFYRKDFTAEWFPAEKTGRAVIDPSEYTLDTFMRAWFSTMLLNSGGALIHSAGLAKNRRGYLFIGPSGSGKTTLSGARGDGELLSDELVAVRKTGDGYVAYGTPFMGELGIGGKNIGAALKNFFIVNHDAPAGRFPVGQAEAAAELWGTLMCFDRRSARMKSAMDFCSEMAAALPCEKFSFDLSQNLWDWMD